MSGDIQINSLHWFILALHVLLSLYTAGHALLYKRDPRAAFAWIAVSLGFPFIGPLLYFLLGINRVRTRGRHLKPSLRLRFPAGYERSENQTGGLPPAAEVAWEYRELARISDAVTRRPLLDGNHVELLHNGEQAYPAMLKAMDAAQQSLYLSTYIFDTRGIGRRFVDALGSAVARGVTVRVLMDGFGELYSLPWASRSLKRLNVPVARFLPPRLVPPSFHVNLRNHRKILVVDGNIGFTGGMNIGDRHMAADLANPSRTVDAHFRVTGPVVNQIEEVFLKDWAFATGEVLAASDVPVSSAQGQAICRVIVDGPDEDLDKLAMVLIGAVSAAQHSLYIMTPYFLPSRELISALQAAALRGVEVCVLLPEKNNQPLAHWAARNMLWELLHWGVHVYYQPAPFVHSKLFVVDEHYVQVGTANIDPRSLRLNFELALEIYDKTFAAIITEHFTGVRARSKCLTIQEMDQRPLPVRLRDAAAWLFSPYL